MKTTLVAMVFYAGLGLALTPAAYAAWQWESFLDGSAIPADPWIPFSNEGSTTIVDVGGGNFALRLDSPDHTMEDPIPPVGTYYNEYYTTEFGDQEILAGARFRLVEFSPTGKENLLSVAVGGGSVGGTTAVAPSITLVDGHYWVWSYTSDEPILDLGAAVVNEWHEAYVLARSDGTAKVRWDGAMVVDGPAPPTDDYDGYVEFGSYWQTTAHTVVDFDWVGEGGIIPGDVNFDGFVDIFDVNEVSANWGSPGGPTGDANHDGNVDIFDVNLISSNWAPPPPPVGAAVPEPSTLWLAVLAVAGVVSAGRYGRR